MLGLIYLFVCFFSGYAICTMAFPKLNTITETAFNGKRINLNSYFVLLPAWYLIGTLCVTWPVYFIAYLFGKSDKPLIYADGILLPLFFVFSMVIYLWNRARKIKSDKERNATLHNNGRITLVEILFLISVTTLACILMWVTFYIKNDLLYVGSTVFSDFSPHLGMIRSFSKGNNYPTWYSHYAGEDIRYHFMFQFLVGNLEFLGLRLDFAFNIPSILSFVSAFVLLYVLSVKITGKKAVGYLACLFFAFRSSKSLFTFLSEIPKGQSIVKTLADNTKFIGYTTHEEWGLWNLNVYCNQRHLAFSLAVIILVIMMFLPYLFRMFDRIQQRKGVFFTLFLEKVSWRVKDYKLAVFGGILLGSIAFWNGAALIAVLSILFLVAICSENRLEFLITAVIAYGMSWLQAKFFIHGTAISPQYYFGFIAENRTLFGAADYLLKLLGILPFVLFAAFLSGKGVKRYLILAFSMPLIIAFTLSLTIDVTVNHKYIMIAVMFLGILAAEYIAQLFEKRDIFVKIGCILIILTLTGTGVYDFITILQKNQSSTAIILDTKDGLTKWIEDNTDSRDIFLTSNYALNRVVLGGAMLYDGWSYFAWSAGYDTQSRDAQVKLMYEADSPNKLKELINKNHIRYIIVDKDNRTSQSYKLKEENIRNTYSIAYQDGEGESITTVYDTEKEK